MRRVLPPIGFLLTILFVISSVPADTLKLKDGNTLNGKFKGGDENIIKFEFSGSIQEFPVSSVVALVFGEAKADFNSVGKTMPADEEAMKSSSVTLPPGTPVLIKTAQPIVTGKTNPNSTFAATLAGDLTYDGKVIAPRGSRVNGRVLEANKAGRFKSKAKLVIDITDIGIGPNLFPLVSDQYGVEGDRSGTFRKVGGAALIGGIVDGGDGAAEGAAIGGGIALLTPGKQIQIPPGTTIEFRLKEPMQIELK